MSAKTTGMIWDLEIKPAKRIVLLAMADQADHTSLLVDAEISLIAWMTGYSYRQVERVVDDLEADGILVLVEALLGRPKTYRINVAAARHKRAYARARVAPALRQGAQQRRSTPDNMSAPTPDNMSGVRATPDNLSDPPDNLSDPPDNLSDPTPDNLSNDIDLPYRKNHDSTTTTDDAVVEGARAPVVVVAEQVDRKITGGDDKTELYHWLRAHGVNAPAAALRNQHHDLAKTQAMYEQMIGAATGAQRQKLIGAFIKALDADGPRLTVAPARTSTEHARASPLAGAPSVQETKASMRRLFDRLREEQKD